MVAVVVSGSSGSWTAVERWADQPVMTVQHAAASHPDLTTSYTHTDTQSGFVTDGGGGGEWK